MAHHMFMVPFAILMSNIVVVNTPKYVLPISPVKIFAGLQLIIRKPISGPLKYNIRVDHVS